MDIQIENHINDSLDVDTSSLSTDDLYAEIVHGAQFVSEIQSFRYQVFFANKPESASVNNSDKHPLDLEAFHVLIRHKQNNQIVGYYRLLDSNIHQNFEAEEAYDISDLKKSNCHFLELSRACVDGNYRDGKTLKLLWLEIFKYIQKQKIDLLIGTVVFDNNQYQAVQKLFENKNLQQSEFDFRQINKESQLANKKQIDNQEGKKRIPSLMKFYLRLGALFAGKPTYDKQFNTFEILMSLQISALNTMLLMEVLQNYF